MKIGGTEVTEASGILVLPRSNGDPVVFRAVPVSISEEFELKVPEPVAPMIQKKDGKYSNTKDKDYVKAVDLRSERRFSLMLIRSLEPSNIEWEKVKTDDPATWLLWEKELLDAGLSEVECNRVVAIVMEANSLDESKIKEARETFLRGQEA